MKIHSTKDHGAKALKMLIYGGPGVGKTTLAGTISEPVLVISAEAGLLSLSDKNIDVIDITLDDDGKLIPKERRLARLGEVMQFVQTEESKAKYKWLFIDSLTEISQNLVENLQLVYPDAKDGIKLWGDYAKKSRSLVKSFRDLPHYNVVFTALEAEDKDENGRRYIRVDMSGKIGKQLPAFFDEVFRMHLIEDINGNAIRILTTAPMENVVAKDRSGKLKDKVEPCLTTIADIIRGGKKDESNAVSKGIGKLQKERPLQTRPEIASKAIGTKPDGKIPVGTNRGTPVASEILETEPRARF